MQQILVKNWSGCAISQKTRWVEIRLYCLYIPNSHFHNFLRRFVLIAAPLIPPGLRSHTASSSVLTALAFIVAWECQLGILILFRTIFAPSSLISFLPLADLFSILCFFSISFVRSIVLDRWTRQHLRQMQVWFMKSTKVIIRMNDFNLRSVETALSKTSMTVIMFQTIWTPNRSTTMRYAMIF